jgi:acyl-homoserine-lactone acylase
MSSKGYGFTALLATVLLSALLLAGCGHVNDNGSLYSGANEIVFRQGSLPPLAKSQVYDLDGHYSVAIRRTTGGVPHIKADNLQSAAFGEGYVQAKDNVCIIADEILKARSQRAKYLGAGPGNINIITDFSFKALGILSKAKKSYPELSAPTKAILSGFAAGYNKYLAETNPADFPPRCAGQPWVRLITPQQLFAHLRIFALFLSGDQFATGVIFEATPPDAKPEPMSVSQPQAQALTSTDSGKASGMLLARNSYRPFFRGFKNAIGASNGWGIGKNLTESGRGALLANPHFPYTGSRRFYQSQVTVPGVINVNGISLIGWPLPIVGFNQDIAWTHTVTTSDRFTVYKLQLANGDPMSYVKDGETKPITTKTFQIQVKTDSPKPETLKKTFYYSKYGPMLDMHAVSSNLPQWNNQTAYTYRDANADTAAQEINQWLGMGRSQNLSQFKSIFEDCGSVLWVNTEYADKDGNAFYIDGSSVPNLSDQAVAALEKKIANNPSDKALYHSGFVLLDGSTSRDDWVEGECHRGLVPFSQRPKLRRDDFVQNSNLSYWATNPNHLMTGYSPLFGPAPSQLTPRTRMGLTMLAHPTDPGLSSVKPAGSDGKFSAKDLINMFYSNRAYMAETLLPGLRHRCRMIGTRPVNVPKGGGSRSVTKGCSALENWNGVFDLDSAGAGTFRVFIGHYFLDLPKGYSKKFDPAHPITTPGKPKPPPKDLANDPMLQALAEGLNDLDKVNITYDAELGDVQHEHTSGGALPGGTAHFTDAPIPWHGGQYLGGAFNVVNPITSKVAQGTRYPIKIQPDTIPNTGGLSTKPGQGWLINWGTSFHFALEFKDSGPVAYGLLSYGQSADPGSPYYNDQDRRYSQKEYRKFEFTESEIESDPHLETVTLTAKH